MRIDVALTPSLLPDVDWTVCVVVDVLRASTACVTMFDSGVEEVVVAPDPQAARGLHDSLLPDALLCGEVGGLPPEGFDYGNSPVEFARLSLHGRRAILATSNGTRALHAVAQAPGVFVGSLRNREAVAGAAFAAAAWLDARLLVVCAGNEYGVSFSLDDAVAAGAIVQALGRRCDAANLLADTSDAALAASALTQAFPSAEQAFRESMHGRTLLRLGFAEDLHFCAAVDVSASVPALARDPSGALVLRAAEQDYGR